jgi:hypothetical protein
MHPRVNRLAPALALGCALLPPTPAVRAAPVRQPGGAVVAKVDFERHVMGVFGRMGCNSGSCHGSFQGKGNFRLSLFGYDPGMDYLALTRDAGGRRVDLADPDNSLILRKATGRVPHGGQKRFGKSSWAYQLLRAWVAQGARRRPGSGAVTALRVSPPEAAFKKAGQSTRLRVRAEFAGGDNEDVTTLCEFRTNDEAVAEVGALGEVKGLRPGDTAVIVSYRGNVVPVRVLVPAELPTGFKYPDAPAANFIDREVFAKLRRLNMAPSGLCSDAEFLRRVTLDTIGSLPTPDEVRAFLADRRPDKRARKVEELLAHPRHAALWATKFCDITGNNTDALENPPQRKQRLSQMWHDWFRKRLAENLPYDEIVRGVLCATSREGHSPEEYVKEVMELDEAVFKGYDTPYANRATLDLFWRRQQKVATIQWGEKTAAAFLGVRLECAQCHKHPFDRWTQQDYRAFANVFAPVVFGVSPESQKAFRAAAPGRNKRNLERQKNVKPVKGKKPGIIPLAPLREVFVAAAVKPAGLLRDPDTKRPLTPRALGGPELPLVRGEDPREALFEWMRAPDNPFFARSFANRVWGHYFGVGIVQPVDDFSLANPPSNPKLLDALARYFVENHYDIRALERAVLNSRAYQLSSVPNATNRLDRTNFSHAYVRPLMAEVVVDMLDDALGTQEKWGPDAPAWRAIEVGASRVNNGAVAYAFRVFGRPPRASACDCERTLEPGLPQKLFLIADPSVQAKLRGPNRLNALLKSKDDEAVLDELFLATLARHPTARERAAFAEHRAGTKDRRAAFADTLWALINTPEFIFNH